MSAPMPWYMTSDSHHEPLATRLVSLLEGREGPGVPSSFAPTFWRVDDLGGLPGRAAGGLPVQDFKFACVLRALDEVPPDSHFVWSDVDVQPLVALPELRAALEAAVVAAGRPDILFQREFGECGVNVGVMVVRATAATRQMLEAARAEMRATKKMDQKVVNGMLLSGTSGASTARLPDAFWASSNVLLGAEARAPALANLVLHHANFVSESERAPSSDPRPKLRQLELLADLKRRANDADAQAQWQDFVRALAADPSLSTYRDRFFKPADRAAWDIIHRTEQAAEAATRPAAY